MPFALKEPARADNIVFVIILCSVLCSRKDESNVHDPGQEATLSTRKRPSLISTQRRMLLGGSRLVTYIGHSNAKSTSTRAASSFQRSPV